jgi:pimeloyl-ACP methyl ester carboxylesterase
VRRWLARLGLGLVGLLALVVLVGATYEQYMRHQAARRYPPMGKLVDVGDGRHLQIDCRGLGIPTVVFEAGGDNLGSLAWAAVHDSVAKMTRACAYSRAGMLWSDPVGGPFDSRAVAKDLHTALTAAGEHPPYIMVGHSLGGPYIMIFTSLYPAEVAGLVFVDASHPDQVDRMRKVLGSNVGGPSSQLLVKMLAALSWTGVARILPLNPPGPATTKTISTAYAGTSLSPLVREAIGAESTLQVAGRFRTLGSRPLVVLTGTKPHPPDVLKSAGLKPDQDRLFIATWEQLHDDEATWSRRSRHQLVPDATHYIQFDRPDVVIAAVREVIAETAK